MKAIIRIIVMCTAVLIGSSFIGSSTGALPVPEPDYTMIDINDPPSCYAIKITLSSSVAIQYSPTISSFWNMDGWYYTDFTVYVYKKQYSYSGWSYQGYISSNHNDVDLRMAGNGAVSCMSFDYEDLTLPPPI